MIKRFRFDFGPPWGVCVLVVVVNGNVMRPNSSISLIRIRTKTVVFTGNKTLI